MTQPSRWQTSYTATFKDRKNFKAPESGQPIFNIPRLGSAALANALPPLDLRGSRPNSRNRDLWNVPLAPVTGVYSDAGGDRR
eukprot:CAMPEP_0205825074 /NCGR_PEP_ID=MMETSP0206-20130828/23822_1 /ASSEMBLY_ACC=CAM_ASM_000279 /TAXON_ID=36767 /ORGANISM="Euplotes focardii, Strain TN1" /LENGTH=82 /DNA_ID=CAMNT_0053123785 /DNA_START=56 /DNA_END=300 /DNA_ORIENTATION=+